MGRALTLLVLLGFCAGCSTGLTSRENAKYLGEFEDVLDYDTAPVLAVAARPQYPDMAREIGVTGRVVLKVLVLEDGGVGRVQVLESPSPILLDEAVTAVRNSVFIPAKKGGSPCRSTMVIPFIFDKAGAVVESKMGLDVDRTEAGDKTEPVEPPRRPDPEVRTDK